MFLYLLYTVIILCLILTLAYIFVWIPPISGFRVLMYHHIKPSQNDGLCVSSQLFEQQLSYLKKEGYHFISGSDFYKYLKSKSSVPKKSILVTFDDAYLDFADHAVPVLRSLGIPAIVFVPTSYIGGVNEWDQGQEPIMNADQLKSLPNSIELGIHCHQHISYGNSMVNIVEDDITAAERALDSMGLRYLPFLAYPYGAYPRRKKTFKLLKSIMKYKKVKAAFRIGNKVNPLTAKPKYLIKRLDIRGDESFLAFKRKIKYGKL